MYLFLIQMPRNGPQWILQVHLYPDALKAVDDGVWHMETAIVFVFISVEKAGSKEAEEVFFHKRCMANIFFSLYKRSRIIFH